MPHPLWNVPNFLSLSRLPLAAGVFAGISLGLWPLCLVLFLVAAVTDWADGWWARKYGPLTVVGRNLDPMTDKVLVCGCFIYLLLVPSANILPWMTTVIIGRELVITGLRGIVEATGKSFGADWFGKMKMVLQSAVLIGVFLIESLRANDLDGWAERLAPMQTTLLYLMLAAVVGSAMQYGVRAGRLLR